MKSSWPIGCKGFEPVAETPDRHQKYRFVRLLFNLLAEAANMHIHCSGRHEMLLAPHLPKQLLAGPRGSGWVRKNSSSLNSVEVSSISLLALINAARCPVETERTHAERGLGRGIGLADGADAP